MPNSSVPPSYSILVTGGTGFLGQALCNMLLAKGHKLTLWVRDLAKGARLYGQRVRCVSSLADLGPEEAFDAILNFAGEPVLGPRWSSARKEVLHASRSGVTQALVDWVARAHTRPRLMFSASAIGYYGTQPPGDPSVLGEDAPSQPIFMSELCQRWEQTAMGMAAYGVSVVVLRLGVVLGQDGALPRMLQPFRFGVGVQLGRGDQVFSWVHVDDVVTVVSLLLARLHATPQSLPSGPYNLTAPLPITQSEFTQTVGQVLRCVLALPAPAMLLDLVLGEQATLLTDGQRVVPQRLLGEGYRFKFEHFEAALRDIEQRRG
ncbi:TIGR01777 family oxidoreductase [Rhodoferax sp.]|uniref:TIGR01777 family oxidoreductase n=1 Tax=Rhodoferax sp. TaxID=50421 RepID=UPI00374D1869